ncbi:hypothetical protein GCM10010232_11420 [Streptomyces amakusaensis]
MDREILEGDGQQVPHLEIAEGFEVGTAGALGPDTAKVCVHVISLRPGRAAHHGLPVLGPASEARGGPGRLPCGE